MGNYTLNTVKAYLDRADETRAIARTMRDKGSRDTLLQVAATWEIMAAQVARMDRIDDIRSGA
jgi:hypothetical protein